MRRAKMADAGKVRYRVYSSPTEFIAVIAESALMAVKVAGISEPYRIVRDLPTEGVALEAEKIAQAEASEKVNWSTTPKAKPNFTAELADRTVPVDSKFVPLKLRDLTRKQGAGTRILPPEALNALIEEMIRKKETAAAPRPGAPMAPALQSHVTPAAPDGEMRPVNPPTAGASEELSPEEVEKLLHN